MLHTPLRRLAAGATATALLAGAFLIPAAIAAADELPPGEATESVVGEPSPEAAAPDDAEASELDAAPDEADEQTALAPEQAAEAVDLPTPDAATPETPVAAEQLVPTAASTDDPQDPSGEIAPGDTLEIPYTVTGAKMVFVYAIGASIDAAVVRGDGFRVPLNANGVVHSGEYYWLGQPDGVWTLQISNIGTRPITPEYELSYSTSSGTLELFSSANAPALSLTADPIVDGSRRSGLTVLSELTGPDGTTYSKPVPPIFPGSTQYSVNYTGLPDGRYFARVWTVVDG
ncbi:hypothetical protein FJ656_22615, partial [Schumannella luteola]